MTELEQQRFAFLNKKYGLQTNTDPNNHQYLANAIDSCEQSTAKLPVDSEARRMFAVVASELRELHNLYLRYPPKQEQPGSYADKLKPLH